MDIITETSRLIIAKIEKSDADSLFQLTNSIQVMRYFPKVFNYIENNQMIENIIGQYGKYGYCFWKLLLKKETEFIGIAGLLHQQIGGIVETEISYRINPQYWNSGYATEAAKACKEYAEKKLHKKRLISLIHPENIASKCVAEKLGAKKMDITTFMDVEHEIYVY